jgi:predicted  nucleic acid-binding Zn-ribbon protein
MSAAIEQLDAEIARLQVEMGTVERALPTIAERFAAAEAELRDAEQIFQRYGFKVSAAHPAEAAHLQRQALIGAMMVVGGDRLLRTERARIEAQGEGLTAADKARRLEQLRHQILQAAARRELAVREIECDGEFQPRVIHPELAIYKQAAVERLAAR